MSNLIKEAHDAGIRQAMNDFSLSGRMSKEAEDLSPITIALATGLLPYGAAISPVVSAIAAPQDRALSRAGHVFAGGLGGAVGGGTVGTLAGYQIGKIIDKLREEDSGIFADHKYRDLLRPAGAILGAVGGSALGAGYGQSLSQSNDPGSRRSRD
jgi:hypothetical protein